MCANYIPVTQASRLLEHFGVQRTRDDPPGEVWPVGTAPFVRLAEEGSGNRLVVEEGLFGLLPGFARELAFGRNTYNARFETVSTKPSFKQAWARGWRCIVPAEAIYEPSYEGDGRTAVRWRITHASGEPMRIAGIYRKWRSPAGEDKFSFAMLTINANGHPVMQRFHKPQEEKRMVVILDHAQEIDWLTCQVGDAPAFCKQWRGLLDTVTAPLPSRKRMDVQYNPAKPPKSRSLPVGNRLPTPPPPATSGDLF